MSDGEDIRNLSLSKLRTLAIQRGIKSAYRYKKSDLLERLAAADKSVVNAADSPGESPITLDDLANAIPEGTPERQQTGDIRRVNEPDRVSITRERRGRSRRRRIEEGILDSSQLVPIAGVLDVLDSCAFIRTTGYSPGDSDIYVSLSQVKKYSLRKGDAVAGEVARVKSIDSYKQRHFPLVSVNTVNGLEFQQVTTRPAFESGMCVPPTRRLRITPKTAPVEKRIVDLVSPVAKGTRGLVRGPSKSGRTTVLHEIAAGLCEQNKELHLITLLVGIRPEEATHMSRTLRGEVVVSSMECSPEEQVGVAELVLERSKRLVEQGRDVLLIVDSMTHLGRAYALVGAPPSRLIGSAAELSALRPITSFFLSARCIENSGSITMLATVLSESESAFDRLVEYDLVAVSGMQLVLDKLASERRDFPAINPIRSSSRDEFTLLSASEQSEVKRLRVRSEGS
ncbi:transcription termination factor Rho [Tropheryma whipplei]|uniref:transcription termination factor Rho n=1 Tax=Tropheryma whipplei TaxID=2039 RepID=UPI0004B9754D|nr:transcription termination factor Rho [Tropheryma whipplei]